MHPTPVPPRHPGRVAGRIGMGEGAGKEQPLRKVLRAARKPAAAAAGPRCALCGRVLRSTAASRSTSTSAFPSHSGSTSTSASAVAPTEISAARAEETSAGLCPDCLTRLGHLAVDSGDRPRAPETGQSEAFGAPQVAAPTRARPGDWRGPYRLLEEIGQGGMGVVWLASHHATGRFVALKVPCLPASGTVSAETGSAGTKSSRTASAGTSRAARQPGVHPQREAAWSLREARLLSLLDHPHILPIYEVGEGDTQPWFAMKLAQGGTLAETLARRSRLPPQQAVTLAHQLASALAHAHAQGILHLDLKPENVLLDEEGRALLADFGVGYRDGERESGGWVGTPGFAAPEVGQPGAPLTVAVDIFSAGATLYRMLAGELPFAGADREEIRRAAQLGKVRPLTREEGVPRELWRVIRKCLEADPLDRYPSAAALQADLSAWLNGREVSVQRRSPLGRASRLVRRSPRVSVLIFSGLAALTAGLGLALIAQRQQQAAVDLALRGELELARARAQQLENAQHWAHQAEFAAQRAAWWRALRAPRVGTRRGILDWVQHQWAEHAGDELRTLAIQALTLPDLPAEAERPGLGPLWPETTLTGVHSAPVTETGEGDQPEVSNLPEGGDRPAARARAPQLRALDGDQIRLEAPGVPAHTLDGKLSTLAWDPAGAQLAFATVGKRLWLWQPGQPPVSVAQGLDSPVGQLVWHPQRPWVAAIDWRGQLKLWELRRQRLLLSASLGLPAGCAVVWSADGQRLIVGGGRRRREIPVEFPQGLHQWQQAGPAGQRETFPTVALDAARRRGLWVLGNGIHEWDWDRDELWQRVPRRGREWLAAAWNGPEAVAIGWNSGVQRLGEDGQLRPVDGPVHSGWVLLPNAQASVARPVSSSASQAAASRSAGPNYAVVLARPEGGFLLQSDPGDPRGQILLRQAQAYAAAVSADGQRAATSGFGDGVITLWTLPETRVQRRVDFGRNAAQLAFSPDGRWLGCAQGNLALIALDSGTDRFPEIGEDCRGVGWTPDGRWLLVGTRQAVEIWDADGQQRLARLSDPDRPGSAELLSFAVDRQRPVVALHYEDGTMAVWDLGELAEELHRCGIDWE